MTRVLTGTVVGPGHTRLGAAPRDALDPVVRELVDAASAEAFARGFQEGHDRGVAAAERELSERTAQLRSAIAAAVSSAAGSAQAARDEMVESAFALATAMAAAILDHEPHDGGAVIAGRIRDALALVEDPAPVLDVSAADREVVAAAVADLRTVTVEVDPSLGPGEARLRGGWAEADLTHAAAFAAIRRALDVDG